MQIGEGIPQSQIQRNIGVLYSWFPTWIKQSAWNLRRITEEYDTKPRRVKSLYELQPNSTKPNFNKLRMKRGPAIIVGAGPSLDYNVEKLKKSKMPTFVPETLVGTLKYHGVRTDYVMNYDCAQHWEPYLKGLDVKNDTLITHPAVDPELIEEWPGEKIYYLMHHIAEVERSTLIDGMSLDDMIETIKKQVFGSEFFEAMNPILYPQIQTTILNAGCIVNNAIQVANFMGYGPLFLVGVDFGFVNDQSRAKNYYMKKGKWELSEPVHGITTENVGRTLYTSNNGIVTTEEMMEYKLALMSIYRIEKSQLYDCSDGIITELPKIDIAEVIKKNGKGFRHRDFQTIERICLDYFDRWDAISDERNVDRKSEEVRSTVDEGTRPDQQPVEAGGD